MRGSGMKKNRKKQKGFSLVELIVVIAVMAVLVVVLAPAYLRYVDKARLQKDVSAIGEVVEAIKIAAAEEDVANEITIPDFGSALAEAFGYNAFAQVVVSSNGGNITANKLTQGIQLNESYFRQLIDLIENFGQAGSSLPRETAPNLQREVTETIGTSIEFEREELNKLDVILTVTRDADYKIHVTVNASSFKNYPDVEEALKVFGVSSDNYNEAKCVHTWDTSKEISVCTKCNEKCSSHSWRAGKCQHCTKVCDPHEWSNGECSICDVVCEHEGALYPEKNYTQHKIDCGTCEFEGFVDHDFRNGTCSICGFICDHVGYEYYEPSNIGALKRHTKLCKNCESATDASGLLPSEPCTFENGVCTKKCGNTQTEGEGEGGGGECITPDTLITLADRTQKRVDQLDGTEELLVWNLETGMLDKAPIMFVDSEKLSTYEVIILEFADGTDVEVISEHGFWDFNLNKYVYLDKFAGAYIGHQFFKLSGDSWEKVRLIDVHIEKRETTAWSPVTAEHLCYFVNGMLSMPGGVEGLFNIFEVNQETLMYDYDSISRDIELYGLFTYEELSSYVTLSEDMFNVAGGEYLKISIGKGNLSMEELIKMIERYEKFF